MEGRDEDENTRPCSVLLLLLLSSDMTLEEYERARQCMQRLASTSFLAPRTELEAMMIESGWWQGAFSCNEVDLTICR